MGFGGDVPQTEQIQNSILLLLEDRSEISAREVIELLYNNHPLDRILHEILQAAQILVNKGMLIALSNNLEHNRTIAIDPVYGNAHTIFKKTAI